MMFKNYVREILKELVLDRIWKHFIYNKIILNILLEYLLFYNIFQILNLAVISLISLFPSKSDNNTFFYLFAAYKKLLVDLNQHHNISNFLFVMGNIRHRKLILAIKLSIDRCSNFQQNFVGQFSVVGY